MALGQAERGGAFTGAVTGLACVTRCAGYVPTWAAFVIGFVAGCVCYTALSLRDKMKWGDALDVWAAHGVGGLLGTNLLGAFAYLSVNAAGANGLFAGAASFFGSRWLPPCSCPPTPLRLHGPSSRSPTGSSLSGPR